MYIGYYWEVTIEVYVISASWLLSSAYRRRNQFQAKKIYHGATKSSKHKRYLETINKDKTDGGITETFVHFHIFNLKKIAKRLIGT